MILTKEAIDKVFAEAETQADYVDGLYSIVISEYYKLKKVIGWPEVSYEFDEYIQAKAIEFDKKNNVEAFPGGLWLNVGFSSRTDLEGGEVSLSGVAKLMWR